MDDVNSVETAVKDAAVKDKTPDPKPPSAPAPQGGQTAPATPAKSYSEEDVKSAVDKARREAQISKDKETVRLHQSYQERLRKTVGKAAQVLEQHGVKDTGQVEQAFVDDIELEEYRAWKQQASAQSATFDYGKEIISDIAARYEVELDVNDPVLWQTAENWDVFKERVRKAANDKVKIARDAARAAEEEARRKAVDSRVASGSLDTLNVTPAGANVTNELDNYSPKDADKLYELGVKLQKERASRQR